MLKGLPLAYNKDMQEDKEAVFDTVDTVSICLRTAAIVLNNVTVNEELTREAATKGYLNATELADYLVKKACRSARLTKRSAMRCCMRSAKARNCTNSGSTNYANFRLRSRRMLPMLSASTRRSRQRTQLAARRPSRVAEALAAAKEYLKK